MPQQLEGLTIKELEGVIGDKNVVKLGQGKGFREGWIAKGSDGKIIAKTVSLAYLTVRQYWFKTDGQGIRYYKGPTTRCKGDKHTFGREGRGRFEEAEVG